MQAYAAARDQKAKAGVIVLLLLAACSTPSAEERQMLGAYVAGCQDAKTNAKTARTPEQADRVMQQCEMEAERYLYGDEE
jgi:uncharacterized lipoprotein